MDLENGKTLRIELWDTASSEKFTNKNSFENVNYWLNEIRNYSNNNYTTLVGNGLDLVQHRVISTEEGKKFAQDNNLLFYEVSTFNGNNVTNCFHSLMSL